MPQTHQFLKCTLSLKWIQLYCLSQLRNQ
jgi:hypothetical protein